ncbi:C25 family cysteine peptidase [Thermodesulfobacteriota bacterium]
MKRSTRLVLITAILFLMAGQASIEAEEVWVSFGGYGAAEVPEIAVEASDFSHILIDAVPRGMYGSTVITQDGLFSRLSLLDAGRTTAVGSPELPVIRRLVQVPLGADVSVRMADLQTGEASLAELGLEDRIYPVQAPLPKTPGAAVPFEIDQAAYASDSFIPSSWVSLGQEAFIRGRRVVTVEINPVRYNAALSRVQYLENLEIELVLEGADRAATENSMERTFSPAFSRSLDGHVLNLKAYLPAKLVGRSEGTEGVLVITADDYEASVGDMIDWKEKKGFRVEVVPTSLSGGSASQIKSTIQTAFDTWANPPLTYVILVGDTNTVPSASGKERRTSDLYYTTLAGSDYLHDVMLGRISVRSASQAAEFAAKVASYEQADFPGFDWIMKAAFIATSDSGNYTVAEGTHNYCISNFMDPNGYASDKLYAITYNASGSDVRNAVSDGRSLVIYSGHGSQTSWQGPSVSQSNVEALTNGLMLPFVCSHACLTGSIGITTCFGETWIQEAAIGFWGASDSTYWDEDDVLQKGVFHGVYDEGLYSLGAMTVDGLLHLYNHYGGAGMSQYYFEVYHLLGDPSVEVWTGIPTALDADLPEATPVGLADFVVSVTDAKGPVEGALVCITKNDEGIREVGVTGADGIVALVMDPAPANVGEITVTVTAHNRLPFEASSLVISPEGPYLIFDNYAIDDSAGNGDGAPNPGETVTLELALLNVGTEEGTTMSGVLSTDHPLVTVLDDEADLEDMAPWATGGSLSPHFSFTSDGSVADHTIVEFSLDWTADGGYAETTNFEVEICADADGDDYASCLEDCDDTDPDVNPDGIEVCDGVDNDCDGQADEGFTDADGDGAAYCVDCNEADPTIYNGAEELCDLKDNDCDGFLGAEEVDADGDDYMICENDCDDTNDEVNPGHSEVRRNDIDDDCDGAVDETDFCFIEAGIGL